MFQFQFWNIEVETSLLNFLWADVEMSVVQKLLKEEAILNVDSPSTAMLKHHTAEQKCDLGKLLQAGRKNVVKGPDY